MNKCRASIYAHIKLNCWYERITEAFGKASNLYENSVMEIIDMLAQFNIRRAKPDETLHGSTISPPHTY